MGTATPLDPCRSLPVPGGGDGEEMEARIGILSEQMSEHADRAIFISISTAYAQSIPPGVNT